MIAQVGEPKAKAYLREYFSKPENIDDFSQLFPDHIQSEPPPFHLEIYKDFSQLRGFAAKAAPRGFSKSTITDLVLLCWAGLHAKRRFIVLISDTYGQATMLMEAVKTELETNELIRWLYEDPQGGTWTDNDIEIMGIDSNGVQLPVKIIAKGAGMKIRGLKFLNFRPDLIIFDDLENDEAVRSEDRRRKLKNWLVRGVIPALAPEGCIWYIGTVLHRDSLLSNILDKKDEFASWRSDKYASIIDGAKSLWPERFSLENLIKMRDDPTYERYIGPLAFAQEMQNTPMNEEDQVFQTEWLSGTYNFQELLNRWHAEHPEAENSTVLQNFMAETFKMIVGAVDPAISEKQKADWWAMATIGITKACPICEGNPPGHIMQLDMERMKDSNPNNHVIKILDSYRQWKHDKIKIETVQYQAGLYTMTMQKGAELSLYPPIRSFKPDRDKHRRAVIFSATAAGKMFHMRKDHPLYDALYNEFIEFPQAEHDDMIDAIFASSEDVTMKTRARTFNQKASAF
jgi:predicted phage terminase large subunit-like protein